MEKEMMQIGKAMRKNIEQYVDDFLSWLIIYSDEDSELIKMISAPEEEQQHFLEDLRKATRTREPQKPVIQKLVPASRVPTIEKMFTEKINKTFQGWSSGKPGVTPEGFALHEQLEDLKKKRKRGKKRE